LTILNQNGEYPRFEQLLAKLARMAGIELKIQAHQVSRSQVL